MNHKYPHLLPQDVGVWELFLATHDQFFDTLDYDVRVGVGRPREDLPTPNMRRMATDLSQRRIDVVGHTANVRTIIEITHSAGLKALGQMHAYPPLYRATYPGDFPLKRLLVAGELQSDLELCLIHCKIPFWTPNGGIIGF
jgi:hypothetical protein